MASKAKKPAKSTSVARRPGDFRTLADLNRRSGSDSDSDSDDDAPSQSHIDRDKCGKLVQDSSKCTNNVNEMCNRAKHEGAVEGPVASLCTSSSTKFTGTARLLSDGMIVPAVSQPHETVVHNIVFWHDGFSVNDGPIRSLDDPANASFLESIRKSECPKELDPAEKRVSINVNLFRRDENCPKANIPFQGIGRALGSSDTSPHSTQPASASSFTPASAQPPCIVDQTRPSTPIQIRLADGTRVVGQFNYHHRITDIRAFIDASRPEGSRTYQLRTVGFPPKELNDLDQTVEQAGLANSVIMQKL